MIEQPGRAGRPRSEQARLAVLHAVDDLLVEQGYAAMTMKGIAERAGVGRQTVYRWWSTKAEVLLEASVFDARQELTITASGDRRVDVRTFLDALVTFLTTSDAGLAYRALLGEAQHDAEVARLIAEADVVGDAARAVLGAVLDSTPDDLDAARLAGPVVFWIMSGRPASRLDTRELADAFLAARSARAR